MIVWFSPGTVRDTVEQVALMQWYPFSISGEIQRVQPHLQNFKGNEKLGNKLMKKKSGALNIWVFHLLRWSMDHNTLSLHKTKSHSSSLTSTLEDRHFSKHAIQSYHINGYINCETPDSHSSNPETILKKDTVNPTLDANLEDCWTNKNILIPSKGSMATRVHGQKI